MTSDPVRPDPDALLSLVNQQEGKTGRGRLRVYLGANAGVGKTYAMLEWAHSRLRSGMDVVVGLVETHRRPETAELVAGLEVMPRTVNQHRHVELEEFDLDGALRRHPELLVLDELAHTNAPGSRHDKRWQDVDELLRAGISVVTALNIQHLESLNDVVEQITGVRVQETVPDQVVEQADEIVLVDLSPQELLRRLRVGKVYQGAQAVEAQERFFRPGNLLALRELALRFVAGRVGAEAEVYRHALADRPVWATGERLLVAVGPSPSSARLIRSTRRLAAALDAPWIALNVRRQDGDGSPGVRIRSAENIALAESLGAEVMVVHGDDVAAEILRVARTRNVTKIVAGKPIQPGWKAFLWPSPVDRIIRESAEIDVYVIAGEAGDNPVSFTASSQRRPRVSAYLVAISTVVATSLASLSLYPWIGLPEIIMLYLAAVAVTAAYASRGAMVLGCVLSVVAFNVLFVPPRFSLNVESHQYLVTFSVMLLAGGLISTLSARLRNRANLAREGERRMEVLSRLAARLASVRGQEEILRVTAEEIAEAVRSQVVVHGVDSQGRVAFVGGYPVNLPSEDKELAVAQWVAEHNRPAGRGTDTLGSALLLHLPAAVAGSGPRAVIGVYPPREREPLDIVEMQMVQSLCSQAGLALEADILAEERRNAEAERESERLRSAILSSVSHDLRTPIAAILGCATSLIDQHRDLEPGQQDHLLTTIRDQAARMSNLVANLLEMTRLENGGVRLRWVAMPVEELVGSALTALRPRMEGRVVELDLPASLPYVRVDEVLIHLVLVNLLDNALAYSGPDTPIRLSSEVRSGLVVVEVADRGRGLEPGEEARIFTKFERGAAGTGKPGTGIGLAIARTVIEAHGGSIQAANRPGGGAVFSFSLAIAEEQPFLSDEL